MIMSAQPISAFDPKAEWRKHWAVARAAGWSHRELWWEALQEAANEAVVRGETKAAIRLFRRAWLLSLLTFPRADPRRATSLANMGAAARLSGAEARARRAYAQAAVLWSLVPTLVHTVEIAPRARSSLFHLRMEALHRATYDANRRRRLAAFVAEVDDTLAALGRNEAPRHRHFERWRGEKPPIFDGSRRVLSAALLIATPGSTRVRRET
jgi:hypothetical protein